MHSCTLTSCHSSQPSWNISQILKFFKIFGVHLTVKMPKGQSEKGESGKGGGGGKRRRKEEEDPLFTPDNSPKKSRSTKDPAQDPALEEEEEEEEEDPIVETQAGTST